MTENGWVYKFIISSHAFLITFFVLFLLRIHAFTHTLAVHLNTLWLHYELHKKEIVANQYRWIWIMQMKNKKTTHTHKLKLVEIFSHFA